MPLGLSKFQICTILYYTDTDENLYNVRYVCNVATLTTQNKNSVGAFDRRWNSHSGNSEPGLSPQYVFEWSKLEPMS